MYSIWRTASAGVRSTIRTADRIVVLDSGRVEAVGTHDELLSASPTYAEIVDSQRTPEEAA